MGTRQVVLILAIVVLAVAAYLVLRPPGGDSNQSQPSPHAIDQSQ
jgi:hypothetical protein